MNAFFLLILEFFKTGLFSVGGGLATIPFLYEMISRYGWFTEEMLTTMIAVSESTPGPMGVNMATYVGYHLFGVPGALASTLSLVAPSIIVISIVAKCFDRFKKSQLVQNIFQGLRPAVIGLILSACMGIITMTLFHLDATDFVSFFNLRNILILAIVLVIYVWKKPHPILVIVACGILGVLLSL